MPKENTFTCQADAEATVSVRRCRKEAGNVTVLRTMEAGSGNCLIWLNRNDTIALATALLKIANQLEK